MLMYRVIFSSELANSFGFKKAAKSEINLLESTIDNGKIKESYSWKDKLGVHLIAVIENQNGNFCEPNYSSQIFVYQYLKADSNYKIEWKIKDFVENKCSTVRYLDSSIKIIDIDKDGIAESSFLYGFFHDCCDPIKMKYILHSQGAKLAIRGQVTMTGELSENNYSLDKAFDKFPKEFKIYASNDWNTYLPR